MKFIKKYIKKIKKIRELKFICKYVIIKSIVDYSDINIHLQKKLYNMIDIHESDDIYTCLFENFSIYYNKGIFEMSIPHCELFDLIEYNLSLYYKIVDIPINKYNHYILIQFI